MSNALVRGLSGDPVAVASLRQVWILAHRTGPATTEARLTVLPHHLMCQPCATSRIYWSSTACVTFSASQSHLGKAAAALQSLQGTKKPPANRGGGAAGGRGRGRGGVRPGVRGGGRNGGWRPMTSRSSRAMQGDRSDGDLTLRQLPQQQQQHKQPSPKLPSTSASVIRTAPAYVASWSILHTL